MSPEAEIQAQVMRTLKQMGIYAMRINSGKVQIRGGWMQLAPVGTADLAVFPVAKPPVWLECKVPKGKLSAEQFDFGSQVTRLGHKYFVVRSLDDLEPLIKEMR